MKMDDSSALVPLVPNVSKTWSVTILHWLPHSELAFIQWCPGTKVPPSWEHSLAVSHNIHLLPNKPDLSEKSVSSCIKQQKLSTLVMYF